MMTVAAAAAAAAAAEGKLWNSLINKKLNCLDDYQ